MMEIMLVEEKEGWCVKLGDVYLDNHLGIRHGTKEQMLSIIDECGCAVDNDGKIKVVDRDKLAKAGNIKDSTPPEAEKPKVNPHPDNAAGGSRYRGRYGSGYGYGGSGYIW